MIRSYFKTAFRNMKKNVLFSILNIIGLSIGIVTFLVVVNYTINEYSYDSFHKNVDNIYNVYFNVRFPKGEVKVGRSVSGVGPAMKRELSEVKNYARIFKTEVTAVKEESGFKEEKVFWADKSFLDIFSYPLIEGNKKTALNEPYTLVISESTAKKYFGNEKALGQILKVYDPIMELRQNDFKVVGVFKDVPYNSHLQFDMLLSYQTCISIIPDFFGEEHLNTFLYTFVELESSVDINAFEKKMQDLTYKYQPRSGETEYSYKTLPLKEFHRTEVRFSLNHIFNTNQAFLMLLLAAIVLIVGWFNYINISNVKSMERAKEVGIRKLLGAHRIHLIRQFIIETFIINLSATIMAIIIMKLFSKTISQIVGSNELFYLFGLQWFWACLIIFIIISSLLSGLYPAFVLSSFKPLSVLKGKFGGSKGGIAIRKILMVAQFVVVLALGIGTVVIHKQVELAKSKDKNIDIENVLVLNTPQIDYQNPMGNFNNFQDEMLEFPLIESVTTCHFKPGELINDRAPIFKVTGVGGPFGAGNMLVGKNYFKTFNIDIIAGNDFSQYDGDQLNGKAMLNWILAREFGYEKKEDVLGEKVTFRGDTCEIVGIVDDYKQLTSMKSNAVSKPMYFRSEDRLLKHICIRYTGNDLSEVNKLIQNTFTKHFPGAPYKYEILTDYYNLQYKQEVRFRSIFNVFAILSIILGLIGLIGLVSYILIQKRKQIGIRKVLGASLFRILILLYKELAYLLLIANIIAWPVIYYVMKSWLEDFPLRIEQNIIWYFTIGISVMFIVVMSIFYQVLKVSRLNPVDVLHEE